MKKSFSLEGHKTSIALEAEFWEIITDYANNNGRSIASVIAQIDIERGAEPLASSLRLFCLRIIRNQI